jgi:iron complex outermembrane recepter protein
MGSEYTVRLFVNHIIMKIRYLIVVSMLLHIVPCHGQVITGRVVDANGQPLAGATIMLLSAPDSAYVSGVIADADGRFDVETKRRENILSAQCFGYQRQYAKASLVDGQDSLVVNFKMIGDVRLLNEVVVKGNRIVNNAHGYSMRPSGTGLEKSNTVQEMLAYLPGLNVSQGKVHLFGNLPTIYVNGIKVTSQDELAALQPAQIEKVEVDYLTVGEGANEKGGVLRITTKKQKNGGYSGFVRVESEIMPKYGYILGTPVLAVNASQGKWSVNYYALYANQELLEDASNSFLYADGQRKDISSKTRSWSNNLRTRLNISYELSKRSTLAVSEYIGNADVKNKQHSTALANDGMDASETCLHGPESTFVQQTVAKYVMKTDDRGSNLDITADYLLQNHHRTQAEDTNGERTLEDKTKEKTQLLHFTPKYTRNFANGNKLETGAGYQYIHYNDLTGDLANKVDIHIPSVYANFSGRCKMVMYSAGLTLQRNHMKVATMATETTFAGTYLCPQAMFVWMLNPKKGTMLRLMYQNTVEDMPYSVVNSYKVYSNPGYYTTGNSSLATPRDHSIMLGFSVNQHIQATLLYDRILDPIYYAHGTDGKVTWAKPENGDYERAFGARVEVSVSPTKWWNTKVQVAGLQVKFRSAQETINGQWCGKFWWNNQFTFLPSFGGSLNAYWETKSSLEHYYMKPVGNVDVSLWKTLCHNRLRLSLQSTLWAKGRQRRTEGTDVTTYYNNKTSTTSFLFGVTWNFSGGKKVHQRMEAESTQQYHQIVEKK